MLWTIGHSSRSWDEFLALLQSEAIGLVADVRRFPGSRAHPQFGQAALSEALAAAGIGYRHFPELGGRRGKPAPDSQNTAWRVAAFNAFADHAATQEFRAAFDTLLELAESQRTAIMCSEAVPWRCHRRIIADHFLALGWSVTDIVGRGQVKPHVLPEFARVEDGQVTYPGGTLFD